MDDLLERLRTQVERATDPIDPNEIRRSEWKRRSRLLNAAAVAALLVIVVGAVAIRSDQPEALSPAAPGGSVPPQGVSVERIEAHGGPGGTQEIRFVFDGAIPSGEATYVGDITSVDHDAITSLAATGIGYTTQDITGSIWVCGVRHFGFGPGASIGSIDLLIPAGWFPPRMNAREVPWAPGADPLTVNPPGKIFACGPYKGYVQYSIFGAESDNPEDIQVFVERDSIRVVVQPAEPSDLANEPTGAAPQGAP